MLALSFEAPGRVEFVERRTPRIVSDTDVIVRVTTTAIGPRDIARYGGPDPWPGTVPGAEFCGVVDETGAEVGSVGLGDLVTGIGVFDQGGVRRAFGCDGLDGGNALYVRVPDADNTLLKVPTAAIEERALLLGDTYALGAAAAKLALATGAARIGVIGCDPYGAAALIALRDAGIKDVVALDDDDRRLGLARRLGAVSFDTAEPQVCDTVREETGGDGPGAVIVGAGVGQDKIDIARRLAGPDGVVIHTEPAVPGFPLPEPAELAGATLPVVLRVAPPDRTTVSKTMLALWGGTLDLAPIVSHVMPISDAAEGYRQLDARERGVHKVLLKI
ncbi:MAG: alcohol dehydrogenase catalytic domain-containing protein [Chloroflexi bacterium]|nr:alcohol dehydrogenase catalytic domain-containing protein [Chloroflexota bacterium]